MDDENEFKMMQDPDTEGAPKPPPNAPAVVPQEEHIFKQMQEPTPDNPKMFDLNAVYNATFKPFIDDVSRHYAAGERSISEGIEGSEALAGEKDLNEVINRYKEQEPQQDLTWAGAVLGPAAEAMPFMWRQVSATAAGAAAGFGLGVATAPAEGPAAPAAILAATAFGGKAAVFTASSDIASGNLLLELSRQGVEESVARPAAIWGGALLGAIQTTDFGLMSGVAKKAFVDVIANEGKAEFVKTLGNVIRPYLGNVHKQALLNTTQTMADQVIQTMAKLADSKHKMPTMEDIVKGIVKINESYLQGLAAGAVLSPLFDAAGVAGGKAYNKFRGLKEKKSAAPHTDAGEMLDDLIAPGVSKPREFEHDLWVYKTRVENAQKEVKRLEGVVEDLEGTKAQYRTGEEVTPPEVIKKTEEAKAELKDARRTLRNTTRDFKRGQMRDVYDAKDTPPETKRQMELDARADIDALVKPYVEKKGKLIAGKVDLTTQEVIGRYRYFLDHPTKLQESIKQTIADIYTDAEEMAKASEEKGTQDTPSSPTVDIDRFVSADIVDIDTATLRTLWNLEDKIQKIIDDGRAKLLEKKAEELLANQALSNEVNATMEGDNPTLENRDGEIVRKQRSNFAKAVAGLNRTVSTWNRILEDLFVYSKDTEKIKELVDALDLFEEEQRERTNLTEQKTKAYEKITGGDQELKDLLNDIQAKSAVEHNQGKYVNQQGQTETLYCSDDMLLKLYAILKNPAREYGLRNGGVELHDHKYVNGVTFKDNRKNNPDRPLQDGEVSFEKLVEAQIKERLGRPGEKLIAGIKDFYNDRNRDSYYERINESHKDEYALPMPYIDNYDGYSPRSRSGLEEGNPVDLLFTFSDRHTNTSLQPKSFIELKESAAPYKLTAGAVEGVYRYINKIERWDAFRKANRKARTVFGDKEFKRIVATNFPEDTQGIIDHAYQTIIGTRGLQGALGDKALSELRGKVATSLTGAKLVNSLAQFSGAFNFGTDLTPGQFLKHTADAISNPKLVWDTLSNTEFMKNRTGAGVVELLERKNAKGFKAAERELNTIEAGQWLISSADRMTLLFGWGVYKERKTFYEKTMSPEAAHRKALLDFARAADRQQSSTSRSQQTHRERQGELWKWVFLFQKQPVQALGFQTTAVKRLLLNSDKKTALARLAQVWLATHAAQAMFKTVFKSGALLTGDDKERDEALAEIGSDFFIGAQLPFFSAAYTAVAAHTTNYLFDQKRRPFDPSFILLNPLVRGVDAYRLALKYAKDGELNQHDTFAIANDLLQIAALKTGWALPGLVQSAKAITPKEEKKDVKP